MPLTGSDTLKPIRQVLHCLFYLAAGGFAGTLIVRHFDLLSAFFPAWLPMCFLMGCISAMLCRNIKEWLFLEAGLLGGMLGSSLSAVSGILFPAGWGFLEGQIVQAAIGLLCFYGSGSDWSASALRWGLFAFVVLFSISQKQSLHFLCLCCAFAGILIMSLRSSIAESRTGHSANVTKMKVTNIG